MELKRTTRYTDSYGRTRLPKPGLLTIHNDPVLKVLVNAVCPKCGKKGMAYEAYNQPSKPHYCVGGCKKE